MESAAALAEYPADRLVAAISCDCTVTRPTTPTCRKIWSRPVRMMPAVRGGHSAECQINDRF